MSAETNTAAARNRAHLTIEGTLPYEETWRKLAKDVLALVTTVERLETTVEQRELGMRVALERAEVLAIEVERLEREGARLHALHLERTKDTDRDLRELIQRAESAEARLADAEKALRRLRKIAAANGVVRLPQVDAIIAEHGLASRPSAEEESDDQTA